jgi:undecaprenyl diphosphate synthase
MTSTLNRNGPSHVAIVLDGNGRWATSHGKPRSYGHERGAERVMEIAEAAPPLGITTLTLYVFSTDNWRRPPAEVAALFRILRGFLRREVLRAAERGVKLSFLGRRDRLPAGLAELLVDAERATAHGGSLHLRLAIDYSARDAILGAAHRLHEAPATEESERERFSRLLVEVPGAQAPDVDLLVRTGGEKRLSDFLLWECAYAELLFTRCAWPDFDARALATACAAYRRRERRFGALPARRRTA